MLEKKVKGEKIKNSAKAIYAGNYPACDFGVKRKNGKKQSADQGESTIKSVMVEFSGA